MIGAGSIGARHAANLTALGARVGIVDALPSLARKVSREHGCRCVDRVDDALRSGAFEAAVVCTPNHLHVPIALQVAEAGLHVFIEKPLSNTLDGVDDLLAAIKARSLIGMGGFNLRYEPGLQYMKQTIDPATIAFAQIEFGSHLPLWRPGTDYRRTYSAQKAMGGGIILDDVHEIDYACWLFGYPSEVKCSFGQFGNMEIDVEDTAVLYLLYPKHLVTIHADYLRRRYTRRCKLCTRDGYEVDWTFGEGVRISSERGDEAFLYKDRFVLNDMYVEEMKVFLASIDTGRTPDSDLANAARILEIALAAKGER